MNNQNTYQQQVLPQMMPPMAPMPMQPMGRRARWGRQLMAGNALIKQSLPNWFATFAVGTYAVALLGVNLMFSSYAMEWYFWLFGIAWVAGFFLLSVKYSQEWSVLHIKRQKAFEHKLFWTGFWLRVAYALFIYIFYIQMTGKPFEFAAADSEGYISTAQDLVDASEHGTLWQYITSFARVSFSDMGYPLIIFIPLRIFGTDLTLFLLRIISAFFGALTSVLIYRMTSRTIGEVAARFAGIFCMLHPVLICYVGITLKEVIMTCLLVLFINYSDKILVSKKYTLSSLAPLVLTGFSLFLFRTVLGLVAIMAVFFALVMMDTKIAGWGKKITLGVVLVGAILFGASDNIMREVNTIRNTDVREQQEMSMTMRYGSGKGGKQGGNKFADYAGAAVFAPLIFTIPFPTMVAIQGQDDMRLIHGGNWMRNVMSGFVIMAMFMLLLTGDWRKYTLPLAILLGYLVMLVFTPFAHSLRFHIPVMPFEMMFAAYAITNMRKKHRMWYLYWCMFTIVTCFAWNWFKLKGRGL